MPNQKAAAALGGVTPEISEDIFDITPENILVNSVGEFANTGGSLSASGLLSTFNESEEVAISVLTAVFHAVSLHERLTLRPFIRGG